MMGSNVTPGSKNILGELFDIARNHELYSKRIKELEVKIAEAEEATKRLTKAKDIDAALSVAKQAEQKAKDLLTQERQRAEQIIQTAQAQAQVIIEVASNAEAEIDRAISDRRVDLSALTDDLSLVSAQVQACRDDLANSTQALSERRAEHEQLIIDISAKRQAFAALLGQ